MKMRIIGGVARNTRIDCPPGEKVRPMLAKAREAVFGIYSQALPGACVLDLFAGCGSLGLEALSRGAEWCVFVEKDTQARWTLEENLARARLAERCDVIQASVFNCIERLKRLDRRFKLVFADPPYPVWAATAERNRIVEALDRLYEEGLLTERPWLTVHHVPGSPAPEATKRYVLDEQRKYGRSLISIYTTRQREE